MCINRKFQILNKVEQCLVYIYVCIYYFKNDISKHFNEDYVLVILFPQISIVSLQYLLENLENGLSFLRKYEYPSEEKEKISSYIKTVLHLHYEVNLFVFSLILDKYAPHVTSDLYRNILSKSTEKEIELNSKISDYLFNRSEMYMTLIVLLNESYDALKHKLKAYSEEAFVVATEITKNAQYDIIFSFFLKKD